MGFILAIIIGAIAGWLAGKIVKGHGQGLVVNVVVGILGAVIASYVLPAIGLGEPGSTFGAIVHSTIGAVILLVLLRLVSRNG